MPLLDLNPDELLTTTRSVRLRLDLERPVERSLIEECLRVAQQAPTGGNRQTWSFIVLTEGKVRRALAKIYKRGWEAYLASMNGGGSSQRNAALNRQVVRVYRSAQYLADQMEHVPVLVVPCLAGRLVSPDTEQQAGYWGSILPAVWSFMLAARARGLGTCLTTVHLHYEEDAARLLGIPFDQVTQAGLIPIAHTKGTDFKPASRKPLDAIVHWEKW